MLTRIFNAFLLPNIFHEAPGGQGGDTPPADPDEGKTFDAKYVKELRNESAGYRTKAAELEKKVNELSEKIKAADEEDLKKKGDIQKLADQYKTEADTYKKQVEELTPLKTQLETIQKERKQELIDRLPNDELKAVAVKIDNLELLTEHVNTTLKLFGEGGTKPVDGGRSGKAVVIDSNKGWDDYTFQEREEIRKKSPDTHKKLFTKRYPNQGYNF